MTAGYYAGIGSRETPASAQARFALMAFDLADAGWILRSGGAEGADAAFEGGLASHHPREIFLPWPGFNAHRSRFCAPTREALELAAQFHPAWDRLTQGARRLHARNMHQILGADLQSPVAFVLCWTKEGKGAGGTGQALRLAQSRQIPVFDFGKGPQVRDEFRAWLDAYEPEVEPDRAPRI